MKTRGIFPEDGPRGKFRGFSLYSAFARVSFHEYTLSIIVVW